MMRYWRFVIPAVAALGVVVFLIFQLSSNLVFFNTPTELLDRGPAETDRLRVGGQVVADSVSGGSGTVTFLLTDGRASIRVEHDGLPPELFAENRGVVLEGTYDGIVFRSDTMLVKHDEQYRVEDVEDGEYDPGAALPGA
jgi:cytochrome c-type biogenesis protein CcmE